VPAELQLFEVVLAGDAERPLLCAREGGQKHGREDGDDSDDDKQFDQRKCVTRFERSGRATATFWNVAIHEGRLKSQYSAMRGLPQ